MTPAIPLPEALWLRIPEEVREAVAAVFTAQQERIQQLEARVQQLEAAQARNSSNSSNSSTPPSADPPSAPPPVSKKPSGRKRGARKGHEGHSRERVPADQVKHTIALVPHECQDRGHSLPQEAQPGGPEPTWHQVFELPKQPVIVTE